MCEDIDYKIGVMQAFKEGKVIECRNKSGSIWNSIPDPAWNWSICDYRVKPEPKEDWVVEYYQPATGRWEYYQAIYSNTEAYLKWYLEFAKSNCTATAKFRYRRIEPAKE